MNFNLCNELRSRGHKVISIDLFNNEDRLC